MTHNETIDITEQLFTIWRLKGIKNVPVKTVINQSSEERPWEFVAALARELSAKKYRTQMAKPESNSRAL